MVLQGDASKNPGDNAGVGRQRQYVAIMSTLNAIPTEFGLLCHIHDKLAVAQLAYGLNTLSTERRSRSFSLVHHCSIIL